MYIPLQYVHACTYIRTYTLLCMYSYALFFCLVAIFLAELYISSSMSIYSVKFSHVIVYLVT